MEFKIENNFTEEKDLKKLISNGTKFEVEILLQDGGLFPSEGYEIHFIAEGGAIFVWIKQNHKYRENEARLFKTIDNAVIQIKKIGYKGKITMTV